MAKEKKTTKDFIVFNFEKVEKRIKVVGSPSPIARKLKTLSLEQQEKLELLALKELKEERHGVDCHCQQQENSKLETLRELKKEGKEVGHHC
jgi:hypothetical protein